MLLASALWLSSSYDKKQYHIYAAYFNEAVTGLNIESTVKYNGVTVGSVYKIKLNPTNPQQVELLLRIDDGKPITKSTLATLISQGITGTTIVGLSATTEDLTPLVKEPGQQYPVIPTGPSLLHQLDQVLRDVSKNINAVSLKINAVLDDENVKNFKSSLINIQNFTKVMSKKANKLTKELSGAGENISLTMQAGKSAINKFSGEALPSAMQLLHKLNQVANNLEKISNELNKNPSILIRGTTAPPTGPGEK